MLLLRPAAEPAPLDLRCYRLMAELAADEDPHPRRRPHRSAIFPVPYRRARPGFEPDAAPPGWADSQREQLVGQCGR
jgi:hypothetical protein